MAAFDSEILNIRRVKRSINRITKRIVEENKSILEGYITDDQLLEKGETDTGASIEPPYTSFTISLKKKKGQQTNWVTLKDTGAFHKSIKIIPQSSQMTVISDDSKARDLQDKYEKNSDGKILGIQPENLERFGREILLPRVQLEVRKLLLGI